MQRDAPPAYRFTAKVAQHHGSSPGIETAYAIEVEGLSVMRGGSVRVVPWTAFRFLHLHFTSGVGTTGFPVYSARFRTLWSTREISSLDWQGDAGIDRSADYVRFMTELIPFAATIPESFNVLVKEMRSLGLDVDLSQSVPDQIPSSAGPLQGLPDAAE